MPTILVVEDEPKLPGESVVRLSVTDGGCRRGPGADG